MKLVFVILTLALAAPALVLAVALGPVALGILCAVGFAVIVMALFNFVIGLGLIGRSLERGGVRLVRDALTRQ